MTASSEANVELFFTNIGNGVLVRGTEWTTVVQHMSGSRLCSRL